MHVSLASNYSSLFKMVNRQVSLIAYISQFCYKDPRDLYTIIASSLLLKVLREYTSCFSRPIINPRPITIAGAKGFSIPYYSLLYHLIRKDS